MVDDSLRKWYNLIPKELGFKTLKSLQLDLNPQPLFTNQNNIKPSKTWQEFIQIF